MGSDLVLRGLGSVGFRNNSQIENLGLVGFKDPSRNVFLKFKIEPKMFFCFFEKVTKSIFDLWLGEYVFPLTHPVFKEANQGTDLLLAAYLFF